MVGEITVSLVDQNDDLTLNRLLPAGLELASLHFSFLAQTGLTILC